MLNEFERLEKLGYVLPSLNSKGLLSPSLVDESKISFPSESYNSAETNKEADGFWAAQRAIAIAELLRTTGSITLWEIGAGNGSAAIPLRNLGFNVIPIEPLESGAVTLAKNGFSTLHSTLEELKLPSESIDAIGAFDVLEHLEEPEALLAEIHRVLKPGGTFICSVPAYQWLYSDFDISIGHFRRYTKATLISLIGKSGFKSIHVEYLFGFLVIPALLLRRLPYLLGRRNKFKKVNKLNKSRFIFLSRLDLLFIKVMQIEKMLNLQFGLSIISSSNKPKS